MAYCPNISDEQVVKDFNSIVEHFGGKPISQEEFRDPELRDSRTGVDRDAMQSAYYLWDKYAGDLNLIKLDGNYKITQIKPGVLELFESSPELANDIYEALGFNPIIKGINIRTDKTNRNSLGNRLTNPNWYSIGLMDVESVYKANASKIKAPQLNAEEALKYDMNLMYKLQVQKFRKNPELIDEINQAGGLEFIKQSSHIVGVKNSRWEGKGIESNFIKVLAKSYETVAKELGKFEENTQITPQQKATAQQLYSQYLDTIFPDSKVKDIVYHGANEPIEGEKFTKREGATGRGIWFSGSRKYAQIQMDRAQPSESLIGRKLRGAPTMYQVVLNIKNPKHFYDATGALLVQTPREFEKQYDRTVDDAALFHHPNSKKPETADSADQVVVFEPEQIHILSSKRDLEMFRNFINFTKSEYAKYGDIQQFKDYIMSKNFAAVEEFLVVNNKIDRKC